MIPSRVYGLARLDGSGRIVYLGRNSGLDRLWPTPTPIAALMKPTPAEVEIWRRELVESAARRDAILAEKHRKDVAAAGGKEPPKAPVSVRDTLARELAEYRPITLVITADPAQLEDASWPPTCPN
jgi:hypothetical protein